MKIVIDLQGLQANPWDNQIAQNSFLITRSLIQKSNNHDIYIALNHNLASTIDRIFYSFSDILPREKILLWQGLSNVSNNNSENNSRSVISQLIYENYIKSQLPDVVLTTNLWQGWDDDATTGLLNSEGIYISAVIYYPKDHKDIPENHKWYLEKVSQLKTADLIFTTDNKTNDKVLKSLKISKEKITPLSCHDLSMSREADIILSAFESQYKERLLSKNITSDKKKLKKLAYFSPFPPEQSGIAEYSSGILPELAKYFDIELITNLVKIDKIDDIDLEKDFPKKTVDQFYESAKSYDHILYHFGNSPFHSHMISLLAKYPGTVVMHDFYYSALLRYLETYPTDEKIDQKIFQRSLYESHGYEALKFYTVNGEDQAVRHYPANHQFISNAAGIIVHSQHAKDLASYWYNSTVNQTWFETKLPRHEPKNKDKIHSRKLLGIDPDAFVVCSFGRVDITKQNNKILMAWLNSKMVTNKNCYLFFVGPYPPPDYFDEMKTNINSFPDNKRMILTDFVDSETYQHYLAAADIGIQLRQFSRGESSISVLDCLANKLATIVNACGSFDEIDDKSVYKLPDDFTQEQLIEAIEVLYDDTRLRNRLQCDGYKYYKNFHTPKVIAPQYASAINQSIKRALITDNNNILREIEQRDDLSFSDEDILQIAVALSENTPSVFKNFFIDISILVNFDSKTGIERVTRSILLNLLSSKIPEYKIEPVYWKDGQYYYARMFTVDFLGIHNFGLVDEPIDIGCKDILLVLELDMGRSYDVVAQDFLKHHSQRGLKIYYLVYDLLPILNPEWFFEEYYAWFDNWLNKVSLVADGLIGISQSTANQLNKWLNNNPHSRLSPLNIGYAHLGADIDNSKPTIGINADEKEKLQQLKDHQIILMVGTVEPRKGYDQAIEAMDELWAKDEKKTLVIVGKKGWMIDDLAQKLNNHEQMNKRLFWFDNASDELLSELYKISTVFLMASRGEGFGLPIIEAAQNGIPIIARDLPVFREIAGHHAYYFSGTTGLELTNAIIDWFNLFASGSHPQNHDMPYLTWEKTATNLLKCIFENDWLITWQPILESPFVKLEQKNLKQIFTDISNIVKFDLKTGIERVTRSILLKLLASNIPGYKIEPVYRKDGQYFYARDFTMKFLEVDNFGLVDEPIDIGPQDIFLGLDLDLENASDIEVQEFLQHHSQRGLKIYFIVYDLLPILNPQWFPEYNVLVYKDWITKITKNADGLIGISQSTANQIGEWIDSNPPERFSSLNIGYAHLGADINDSKPTVGINVDEKEKLQQLKDHQIILMVGTVEPRKGHDQAIEAMDELWSRGEQKTLLIVGKKGWMIDDLAQKLNNHEQMNKRLFWFDNASDELLSELYKISTVFLMASRGEGFGLPIIEAAQNGLPIISRDLPVFKEVAGHHAYYFSGKTGSQLATDILKWFDLLAKGTYPRSHDMPYLTWQQSTDDLLKCIFENEWTINWEPTVENLKAS
ncbi:MAG: glycosyltransferase [Alphaproteobacteria bacterium]|nr:glycosyltransferase [Alphaproteobacteria bacterium]